MGLKELFAGFDGKKRKSYFKNLIRVAAADGRIDENEFKYIVGLAQKNNISQSEITTVMKNPGKIKFTPPESMRERFDQMYDLVSVILVDGEVYPNEVRICKILAQELGFEEGIVDELLSNMIDQALEGIAFDEAFTIFMQSYRNN